MLCPMMVLAFGRLPLWTEVIRFVSKLIERLNLVVVEILHKNEATQKSARNLNFFVKIL